MNDDYKSSPIGTSLTAIFGGLEKVLLENTEFIKGELLNGLNKDQFTVLGILEKKFYPQGYSIVALLSESHASIHTYPEYSSLAFTLYSCRKENDGQLVLKYLKEQLKTEKVKVKYHPVPVEFKYFNPQAFDWC